MHVLTAALAALALFVAPADARIKRASTHAIPSDPAAVAVAAGVYNGLTAPEQDSLSKILEDGVVSPAEKPAYDAMYAKVQQHASSFAQCKFGGAVPVAVATPPVDALKAGLIAAKDASAAATLSVAATCAAAPAPARPTQSQAQAPSP